jgi:hypothetical protein
MTTDATLEGTDWRLLRGVANDRSRPITARFVDGTVSGQGPVNRYRALYTPHRPASCGSGPARRR